MRALQIELRPWEERDASSLAFFANEPLIAKNLRAGFPSPYGLDDAKAYIAFCHQQDPTENLCLAITDDDTAVGSIGVFCRGERKAELGYWLGKTLLGQRDHDEDDHGDLRHGISDIPHRRDIRRAV